MKLAAAAVGLVACLAVPAGPVAAFDARQFATLGPLDAASPIGYFISEGNSASGFRPGDRQLATWAFEAWQRNAAGALRLVPAPEDRAVVRLNWAEPSDGQFGEMQPLTIGGRRGAAVYIRPDMSSLGAVIAQRAFGDPLLRDSVVYLTCVHEIGHALGLAHTRDFADVMYFFGYGGDVGVFFGRYRAQLHARSDIARTSGLSASDVRRLRALYPGSAGRAARTNDR